jgi:hypothetical protein
MDRPKYLAVYRHLKGHKPKIIYAKLESTIGPPYYAIPRLPTGAERLN